jgi:thymidylate kinase
VAQTPYRVALVGIDGSGKTSVVARLRARIRVEGGLATLNSPIYHETPNAPLRLLSRQMHAVSLAADELGLRELKAAMLYLQMTLYGIVERSVIDAFRPRCLISDRHALVDTLAYGPVYRRMLGSVLDGAHWDPLLRERLADAPPNALDATIAWHEGVARRLGQTTGFWELPHEVGSLFEQPFESVLAEFSKRYGTELPDAVVLLDLEPAEALRRSSGRASPSSELHESEVILEKLRAIYASALATLEQERPEVAVHRLDVSGLAVEEALDAVLECVPAGLAPVAERT